jgi:hypothetical protein
MMGYTLSVADLAPPFVASYFFPTCTGDKELYFFHRASDPRPEGSTVLYTRDTAEELVLATEELLEEKEYEYQEGKVTFCFTDYTPKDDPFKKSSALPDMLLRQIKVTETLHERPCKKMKLEQMKNLDVQMKLRLTMPVVAIPHKTMMQFTLDIKSLSSDFHILIDHVETDHAECSALYSKLKVYADSKDSEQADSSQYSISWEDNFPYVKICHV